VPRRTVERHDDHFAQDTPDTALLAEVTRRGWIFVTQDRRIRSRSPERRILLDHGVSVVSIASTANLSADDTAATLRRAEKELLQLLPTLLPPFILALLKDGSIRQVALTDDPPRSD
jgi:hypothetical protein